MKILLTGGAGFIGFHTSKKLLEMGHNVISVDNLNDYYDVNLKQNRLKILSKYDKFENYVLDISNYRDLDNVFAKYKFDKVCNLAAQAGVRYSLTNPFVYLKSNIQGFLNILELCRKNEIKDLVYASSSSVYGGNTKYPFSESDRVDNPISLYASTKKDNELMANTYSHLYGLNTTGLRFFTVYGPYGRPDMALFKFTKNIIENKTIDVYNNGEMYRDFTYVDDIVSGVISSLENPFRYEIFNLARGESIKLTEFINEIENFLGKRSKKNLMPLQEGDVPKTYGDISKARRLLNYDPKTSVKGGISKFITWYKTYYNNVYKS